VPRKPSPRPKYDQERDARRSRVDRGRAAVCHQQQEAHQRDGGGSRGPDGEGGGEGQAGESGHAPVAGAPAASEEQQAGRRQKQHRPVLPEAARRARPQRRAEREHDPAEQRRREPAGELAEEQHDQQARARGDHGGDGFLEAAMRPRAELLGRGVGADDGPSRLDDAEQRRHHHRRAPRIAADLPAPLPVAGEAVDDRPVLREVDVALVDQAVRLVDDEAPVAGLDHGAHEEDDRHHRGEREHGDDRACCPRAQ
jgi:hypothetical protein